MTSAKLLVALFINFLQFSVGFSSDGNGLIDVRDRTSPDNGAYHKSVNDRRGFDRSDDFYLETFVDGAQPPAKSAGFGNPMLQDDNIFYEAIDYESASASYLIPRSYNVTTNLVNSTGSLRTAQQSKSSFLKIFRVFAWKGFGLSFEKSVIQWNAFGAGIRVPVSSNFPEWDRNAALPKLSTTFGLNYPYGCKMSISASVPLGTAIYGLMLLGKSAGGFSSSAAFTSFLERLRKQKATDSVKRVGVTATLRFSEAKGLQCYIGPWGFYYPGQVVMQHLLPMIFSVPAVLMTILGFFFQLDTETADPTISPKSTIPSPIPAIGVNATTSPPLLYPLGSSQNTSLSVNKTKSIVKALKKKANATSAAVVLGSLSKSNSTDIIAIELKQKRKQYIRPRGVKYWHKRVLKWAGTKSTGLGYNMGWRYQGLHDASLGSRIVFEIQSFYPFPKTLKRLSSMSFSPLFRSNSAPSPTSIPVPVALSPPSPPLALATARTLPYKAELEQQRPKKKKLSDPYLVSQDMRT